MRKEFGKVFGWNSAAHIWPSSSSQGLVGTEESSTVNSCGSSESEWP